jgi:sugar lactone lactonase YvrE
MPIKPMRWGVLVVAILVCSGGLSMVQAVGPKAWVQSSYEDFEAGEITSVSLTDMGEISLSRELRQIYPADAASESSYVWALDEAPDGTIYASVGSEGRVVRITREGEATTFFEAPSTVYALRYGPDDHLYVGVAQDAAVYRLAPGGAVEAGDPWYVAGQSYVWDMVFDRDGRLYIGTGESGEIHVIDSDGSGRVFYDSSETHITALAIDQDNNLLAGSEESGYVYRISPNGEPFVLFDSPLQQITGLATTARGVYVGGIGKTTNGGGGAAPSGAVASQGATTIVVGAVPGPAASSGNGAVAGAVYLIHADGYVDEMWSSEKESVHALLADAEGVLVGTSPEGRILRVESATNATIVHEADSAQVTGLVAEASSTSVLVASSNPGRVYRLHGGFQASGEYVSQVKDTETTSSWGRVRWRSSAPQGTSIQLRTRAGNTDSPDDTWSEWSGPYLEPEGSQISSPPARYIQWKAELSSAAPSSTPLLQWVELVFVQRNLKPSIDEFRVHPGGVVYRQVASGDDGMPFAQLPPGIAAELAQAQGAGGAAFANMSARAFMGRPLFVPGSRSFSWQASDANGDSLEYAVEYRGEEESVWKSIETDLSESTYTWDTTTVPDGLYVARIVAADGPSNPAAQALQNTRSSQPFVVDNTPPRVFDLQSAREGGGVRVTGSVSDVTSLIRQIEYSIDGERWRTVLPADTLADAGSESIDFLTEALSAGEHTIVIRATDAAYNRGAGQTIVIAR